MIIFIDPQLREQFCSQTTSLTVSFDTPRKWMHPNPSRFTVAFFYAWDRGLRETNSFAKYFPRYGCPLWIKSHKLQHSLICCYESERRMCTRNRITMRHSLGSSRGYIPFKAPFPDIIIHRLPWSMKSLNWTKQDQPVCPIPPPSASRVNGIFHSAPVRWDKPLIHLCSPQ